MKTNKSLETREAQEIQSDGDRPVFSPATDIFEKPDALLIRCDMPGVDENSVEITLKDHTLSINASQQEDRREGCQLLAGEYRTGLFRRVFSIRQPVDEGAIKARLKDGVLDLVLPKAKEALPRRIAIES